MKKVIITILGQDKPGILAKISDFLYKLNCNIENVSQTILQSEFAGIFVVSIPKDLTLEELTKYFKKNIKDQSLNIHVKHLDKEVSKELEVNTYIPFIISTIGPDQKGLVAGITGIIAKYEVNITNLKAVFTGEKDPNKNFMIYEIDIPEKVNHKLFTQSLRNKAKELGLEINIQHRNIFNAVNKI